MVQGNQSRRVAFLLDNLAGGGAEKVMLNLAAGFAGRGYLVDVLVCKLEGALRDKVPENVNVVQLKASSRYLSTLYALVVDPVSFGFVIRMFFGARKQKVPGTFRFLPAIVKYLKAQRPAGLISALPRTSVNAVLANRYNRGKTRVIVGVHINYSVKQHEASGYEKIEAEYLQPLVRRYYRRADAIVAVSQGVAEDISAYLGLPRDRVKVIYNPIAEPEIQALAQENTGHPWLDSSDVPVLIGIGRFVTQKNFPLLLRAFARVRQQRPVRLLLLGGDESSVEQRIQKKDLTDLAERLGVKDDIDMPGFADNPFSYMRKAALLVLSSRFEGLPTVLVEALLCGCPVVSTDCPSGPAEILDGGKYGRLVAIDDEDGLVVAIGRTLDNPPDKEFLRARGEEFSVGNAVDHYRAIVFDNHT